MTGRNIVNAMKTRNTPLARNRPKYMRDLPDGTLLVVDLKLPGNPLTPFETLTDKNSRTLLVKKKHQSSKQTCLRRED